jgi:hypothetical protein
MPSFVKMLTTSTLWNVDTFWELSIYKLQTEVVSGSEKASDDYPTIAARRKVNTGIAGWKAAA